MRKFTIFLLVFSLLFHFGSMQLADANSADDRQNMSIKILEPEYIASESFDNPSNINIRTVTYEEAIQILMKKKNMSLDEAVSALENSQCTPNSSNSGLYVECTIEHDFGSGYTVEAGCLALTSGVYGPVNWSEVVETWTITTGSAFYTWQKAYCHAAFNTGKTILSLYVRGTVTIPIDVSISGGLDPKKSLEKLGYNVGTSIGSTYYRKIDSWSAGFYPPQGPDSY